MSARLLASYLTLAFVVLVLLEVPLGVAHARSERSATLTRLERDAVSVGSFAEDTLQHGGSLAPLRQLVSRYGDEADERVLVVDRSGGHVAFAAEDGRAAPLPPAGLYRALSGKVATGDVSGWLYAAVPVASGGAVHGAVRVAAPLSELDARVRAYALRLLAIAAGVLALVAAVGFLLARSVSRPLHALARAADRAGAGDLGARAPADEGPPEVRDVAASFNTMVERLAELISLQEAFVADASHQLRTPLTALRLRLENGDVGGALAEVERLSRLVDSLLALARAEASPPEPLELASFVAERAAAWAPLAERRGISIVVAASGTALVGADRLGQVLDNLLANAIAAAPAGTEVTIAGDAAELHVADRGPGMSDADRARAFDRFWSRGSGSGLGLPVARRLLGVDGATIELRAREGGGLDVVLGLRRARPHPARAARQHAGTAADGSP